MIIESDAFLSGRLYVFSFDGPFIWCWPCRMLCFLVHRLFVFCFDASFIWCWPSRTYCSFAGGTCFVLDLASFYTDHILCIPCLQLVSAWFQCSLHLTQTESDALLSHSLCVFCFNAHSTWCWLCLTCCSPTERMCIVSTLPWSDTDRIGCFAFPQLVCIFMLPWSDADSDSLLNCSPYVVRFDAPLIWCWMIRTFCPFTARMCSVLMLASSDTDHVARS